MAITVNLVHQINLCELLEDVLTPDQLESLSRGTCGGEYILFVDAEVSDESTVKIPVIDSVDYLNALNVVQEKGRVFNSRVMNIVGTKLILESERFSESPDSINRALYAFLHPECA